MRRQQQSRHERLGVTAEHSHVIAWIRSSLLVLACLTAQGALSENSSNETFERGSSLRTLFPADQLDTLSGVIPLDREIRWTLHVPHEAGAMGVIVFVSPNSSATPPSSWVRILDEHKLIWVAAQKSGNSVPVRQRILAAVMGLTYVQQHYPVDASRVYVAGMSGGGRVASIAITEFPQLFTGALYIVGVNFWDEHASARLDQIQRKRYVFLTGDRDFNRTETRQVYKRYIDAGATQSLLLDLPHFGHQYPNAEQLETAIKFLDADHTFGS
jgi:predicted esterase